MENIGRIAADLGVSINEAETLVVLDLVAYDEATDRYYIK